jgi:hypothetical protein
MATNIGRNTPTADIMIGTAGGVVGSKVSYRAQFSAFSVRFVVPQIDVSTFADEPNTKFESGEVICVVSMTGILQTGGGAWMAFFPPPAAVPAEFRYTSACIISGTFNFSECLATRPTNGIALLSGTAQGVGVIGVAWV